MNKILSYISIILLFALPGCDYKPIFNYKDYQFSINVNKIDGDQKINSIITKNLSNVKGDKKQYYITLTSEKEKNIISKDTKGDPSIFELIINVDYKVEKDGKIVIENRVNRKTTYNNISDKFELESYENTIIENLSNNISDGIVFSILKISE